MTGFTPSEYDWQYQDIQLSSKDRYEGIPARYRIMINPLMKGIRKVELLSYVGDVKAYNVVVDSIFKISSATTGIPSIVITVNNTVPQGLWSLLDLLQLLNANPYVNFQYDNQSGRVVVYRLTSTLTTTRLSGIDAVLTNPVIGRLIGFPSGFVLDPGVLAIQSSLMVPLKTVPQSLVIGFDNWGSAVHTTGNRSGSFIVPIDRDTFDDRGSKVTFSRDSNFDQAIWVSNITLDNLGVYMMDANIGAPMISIEDHSMILRVYYTGNTILL